MGTARYVNILPALNYGKVASLVCCMRLELKINAKKTKSEILTRI